MGNSRKSISNRENSSGDELVAKRTIIGLMPTGLSVPEYPHAPLSLKWIFENGHDIESLLSTGLYYPVYEEELENGTRTKSTSENTIREGNGSERDASSVLYESENPGGDAE